MSSIDKIEKARNKLHHAISNNFGEEKILKYSRQVDKHIIDYYRNIFGKGPSQNSKKPITDEV
ncbi:aspartyl-phosphate phosphatase Spo0E family protein [Tepidanaerobacter sp. GT38]|uniref:Spo0E family sporulation regulatory protein-aspartic acid phosphatase n=1 Tax=Tepidanaerobacter sp. GT38 TaxID=2722793 RepID=UPI001F01D12F|nr:Spo0E family sporulation regulatory protein-aspartic acid phosphatase [Tepidanaerobacter sp. GT38]MCG1013071.1 aspartyl-phosphate phosphatase Spo0E family protein [Tepidanaerobacter sp. GT38]